MTKNVAQDDKKKLRMTKNVAQDDKKEVQDDKKRSSGCQTDRRTHFGKRFSMM
ncbi:MAG: hypothetical protein PHS75_07220 [Anaerolineaceae bacterium]|jgi:hypothetical protein|nr:hypothetical protein [Anaerolineaceae bacterium]